MTALGSATPITSADPLRTPARRDSDIYRDRDASTGPSHPANQRESIGRRDVDTSFKRNPFEGELRRFRGEMSN